MQRKDGPYIILLQISLSSFVIASCDTPDEPLGVYHASALTPFRNVAQKQYPVMPLRKRDRHLNRPPKQLSNVNDNPGTNATLSKNTPPRRDGLQFSKASHVDSQFCDA
ncbi:hypothetical protein HNY73_001211 [Argiope bruennichi]|uniref:Secreted protein n=1 Tax=Argiope bruennichi TaxID=94029 RepID=A0A8T0G4U3_ARGBR|nr:hypothetical protein HNY73_001211 [Argiope bruennichi]